MNEMETERYALTKDQMLRVADLIGDSLWRLSMGKMIEGCGMICSLFVTAVILLVQLYVEKEPSRLVCIAYWSLLFLSTTFYLLFRHRISMLKKEEFREKARQDMLEDMENARVRAEIERLTTEGI